MYCKHCGKEIADDSIFCKYCGNGVVDSSNQGSSTPTPSPTNEKITKPQGAKTVPQKGNRLAAIFLWSVVICVCCTLGYAAIRYEDSKPYDTEHYFGSSAYDPGMLFGGDYQDTLTWIRQDEYKAGITKTAIYSFPIAFGILVLGAILTGAKNKK